MEIQEKTLAATHRLLDEAISSWAQIISDEAEKGAMTCRVALPRELRMSARKENNQALYLDYIRKSPVLDGFQTLWVPGTNSYNRLLEISWDF